ncbi:MAG: YhbY family RNA-binding protein [Phycisphaeraceae bacterium]
MALTSGQRKLLRQRGQTMIDDFRLGKAGLTPRHVANLRDLLTGRELVKLRFGKDVQGAERKTLAEEVCAAVEAECAAITGRTMLLYRANPELETGKRVLP